MSLDPGRSLILLSRKTLSQRCPRETGAGNRGWLGPGHIQDKSLIPDRIQGLALDLGAMGLLFRDGVPHHCLLPTSGHRAALWSTNPLLDAQQAIGVAEP